MAQSFGAVRAEAGTGQPTDVTYQHAASAETISVVTIGGISRMERHQIGFDGKIANAFSAAIDYWFGSGNHARSYFSRTSSDELIELPLTWYSEKGGYWAMSPGYDSPSHAGFSRKATYRCMFCHNAYPEMAAGADRMDNGTKFPVNLPQGIDCQRCHRPRTEPRQRRDRRTPRGGSGKPDCQSCPSSAGAAGRGLFSMPS